MDIRIEADPETVFEFFTDPDKMIQWMGRLAELDPRPGGDLRVDINGEHIARGEYVELDPPNRLEFTWGWEREDAGVGPGGSTVSVTLAEAKGGTLLTLAHSGLPSDEERAAHGEGWSHYLERLVTAGSGGYPGPDPWATTEGADGAP